MTHDEYVAIAIVDHKHEQELDLTLWKVEFLCLPPAVSSISNSHISTVP